MTLKPDPLYYPPRALGREEAARYLGIGLTKFDELVAESVLPKPKRLGRRVLWDRVQLDLFFTDLPQDDDESLQALAEKSGRV